MNSILLNYITQATLGCASGYITNDYAINMLFKEYTPLKLGGVIKKTRQEFIDKISTMVEQDIINKDKLLEIIKSEPYRIIFKKIVEDFFKNSLYEQTRDLLLKDIDGFDKSIFLIKNIIDEELDVHVKKIIGYFNDSIDLESILNENQLEKIGSFIYSVLLDLLRYTNLFDEIIDSTWHLIENSNSMDLDKFNNTLDKLLDNGLELIVDNYINNPSINVDSLLKFMGLNEAVSSSLEILLDKRLDQIIKLDEHEKRAVVEQIKDYTSTDKFKKELKSVFLVFLAKLEKLNVSVYSLLDENFEKFLYSYLNNIMPQIESSLILWVHNNRHELNKLLDDSIDEIINENDGLKSRLLTIIKKGSVLDKNKTEIANIIESYIKRNAQSDDFIENIAKLIKNALKNTKTHELIKYFTNGEENYDEFINIICDSIGGIVNSYGYESIERILSLRVGDLIEAKDLRIDYVSNLSEIIENILSQDSGIDLIKNAVFGGVSFSLDKKYVIKELKELVNYLVIRNKDIEKYHIKEILKESLLNNNFLKSQSFNNVASNESNKILKDSLDNLNNVSISEALNILNSLNNLHKEGSNLLRDFTVENFDVALDNNIKKIAYENLDKLNDDEVADFAYKFMGKELKPIMYFGGALGILVGVLLAYIQNQPLDVTALGNFKVYTMLTYGFVGFITNVFAINMIFKPYKKNKFLSHMPFLKNFAVGYIVKNQESFAKNTSSYIKNDLLNISSIQETFTKNKKDIKHFFITKVTENDYNIINNFINNNKGKLSNGLFSLIHNQLSKNTKKIASFVIEKLKNANISNYVTQQNIRVTTKLLAQKLDDTEGLSSKLFASINKDVKLNSVAPKELLKKYEDSFQNACFNQFNSFINPETKHDSLDKYENILKTLNDRQLKDFMQNDFLLKIIDLLSSDKNINKVSDFVLKKVLEVYKEKNVGAVLDGRLKQIIDKNEINILNAILKYIIARLKESKTEFSVLTKHYIKDGLGFIERTMYSLFSGDDIVDEVIDKIVEDKVPEFLIAKQRDFENIFDEILKNNVYNIKTEALLLELNYEKIIEIFQILIFESKNKLIEVINNEKITNSVLDMKLEVLLLHLHMENLKSLSSNYHYEIDEFRNVLNKFMNQNKESINIELKALIEKLLDSLMEENVARLFNEIDESNVKDILDTIIKTIKQNEVIENLIITNLDEIKSIALKYKPSDIILLDEINIYLENSLIQLSKDEKFIELLKEQTILLVDEVSALSLSFLDDKTKDYLTDVFISSLFNTIVGDLENIIKPLELDKIAKEEIESMEPEKIHKMFLSFADKYFTTLEIYGFWGFVFGINVYVGFSITLLKILVEITNTKEK